MCIRLSTLKKILPADTLIEINDRWRLRTMYNGLFSDCTYDLSARIVRLPRIDRRLYSDGRKHLWIAVDIDSD